MSISRKNIIGFFAGASTTLFLAYVALVSHNTSASVPIHCSSIDYNCNKERTYDPDQRTLANDRLKAMTEFMKKWTKKNAVYDPTGQPKDKDAPGPVVDWEIEPLLEIEDRAKDFHLNFQLLENKGLPKDLVDYVDKRMLDPLDTKTALGSIPELDDSGVMGPTDWDAFYRGEGGTWGDFAKAALIPRYNEYGLFSIANDMNLAKQAERLTGFTQNVEAGAGFKGERNVTEKEFGDDLYYSYFDVVTRGKVLERAQEFVFEKDPTQTEALDEQKEEIIPKADIEKVEPLRFGELDPTF